ncbi:energy transducer TonB [Algiphilus sp. W345]|uniref:Protein TonB n=1 Tax=Banduia mediterranea TaxID=3075609 RepID=A0ABU2WKH4_9GAMM|nr:energy transducer TonB [Algiphilus sp. W345]MDT0497791.1 energy transducer TonB [Algiphilus sp. W345]
MRRIVAVGLAAVVALSLFWLMHYLILSGAGKKPDAEAYNVVDFVRLKRDERLETKTRTKPEKPPPPKEPPPPPELEVQQQAPQQEAPVPFKVPNLNLSANVTGGPFLGTFSQDSAASFGDGELVALVDIQPSYPQRAARAGISGYVKLQITVNPDGSVKGVRVLEAKPPGLFEGAASSAARRSKFKPRIVNGQAQESSGVKVYQFQLSE